MPFNGVKSRHLKTTYSRVIFTCVRAENLRSQILMFIDVYRGVASFKQIRKCVL